MYMQPLVLLVCLDHILLIWLILQTPVIAVVGNDAGWTQISREQVPMFGSNVACALEVCVVV